MIFLLINIDERDLNLAITQLWIQEEINDIKIISYVFLF